MCVFEQTVMQPSLATYCHAVLMCFVFVACLQGLQCNAKHWPCLDGVITVLYVLNNYEGKVGYINRKGVKFSVKAKIKAIYKVITCCTTSQCNHDI